MNPPAAMADRQQPWKWLQIVFTPASKLINRLPHPRFLQYLRKSRAKSAIPCFQVWQIMLASPVVDVLANDDMATIRTQVSKNSNKP
jgi:hypothetical protein